MAKKNVDTNDEGDGDVTGGGGNTWGWPGEIVDAIGSIKGGKVTLPPVEETVPVAPPLSGLSVWDNYYEQGMANPNIGMPTFENANAEQARVRQQQVIQALQRQASGDPNSLAQQQLQSMYAQAQAQQASLGSTMRGQDAGAAMRGIRSGQQGIQRGLAGDQAMLQAQEQRAAQALLAQLYGQQHEQDIGQADAAARGQLQGNALNQAMQQFYTSGAVGRLGSNYQYGSDVERARLGFDLEARDLEERNRRAMYEAAATGAGTLQSIIGSYGRGTSNNSGGYRQIDGQNSIVPLDDK